MSLRLEVWARQHHVTKTEVGDHQHHVTKTVGLGSSASCHYDWRFGLINIMSLRLEVWAHQHHVTKTGGLGSSASCH